MRHSPSLAFNYLTGKCLHVTFHLDAPYPPAIQSCCTCLSGSYGQSHLFSPLSRKTERLQPSCFTGTFPFASSHVSPCLPVAYASFFSQLAPIYWYPFPVLMPEQHSSLQYCWYQCCTQELALQPPASIPTAPVSASG